MNARPTIADADADDPILSEEAVLERWPLLSAERLKTARTKGEIGWMPGKRKTPWYHVSAVKLFLATHVEKPCREPENPPSSNSADNGSPPTPSPDSSIDSGPNGELVELAARRLAQQI